MHTLPVILSLLLAPLAAPEFVPGEEAGAVSASAQSRAGELVLEALDSPARAGSALPNLTRGADGQLYLSWVDRESHDAGVLFFSVLGKDEWSAPREIMRGEDLFLNWADFPSVCALESGVLMAHWLRRDGSQDGYLVEFSISSDEGEHWTTPRRLHSDSSSTEHGFVSIAPLAQDRFAAIWLDGRNMVGKPHGAGEMALYFRTISASGELGKETVLDDRVCDCCQTTLRVTPGGGLLASYRNRSAGEVRDISFVQRGADSESWSQPQAVHDDGWLIAGCPVNGPRVTRTGDAMAIAWFTGADEEHDRVNVAFLGGAATAFGARLAVDGGSPLGRVDLVAIDAGGVLVTWMENAEGLQAEWRARRVWPDGRQGDSVMIGRIPADRASGYLRMAASGGGVVLAWTISGAEGRVETARLRLKK